MERRSTLLLQTVIVLIGIGAAAFLLWEPQTEGVNAHATNSDIYFKDPFLALVYIGSVPFFAALYQAFKALGYVRQQKAFSLPTVNALRTIKYCAVAVIGFVALEELVILLNHGNDDPAGGIFMGLLVTCGAIVTAAAAGMFERITRNAVRLQSEHDLTV